MQEISVIPLPSQPKVVSETDKKGVFEIEGLYPGYGQTIGNSLRRILLSSLKGAVIVSVKIEGVGHEFSTIPDVKEDAVELILNLKQMRFKLHEKGPFAITLSSSGEKKIRGADFKVPSQVEVVTPNVHLATLTSKKARLELEAVVESGLGYTPVEARTKDKVEVGMIALDAAFSPVRHANYEVENMRVGDRTDYNRIRMHVETDGSIAPREAFLEAARILVEQFGALTQGFVEVGVFHAVVQQVETVEDVEEKEEAPHLKLEDLKISSRTLNALKEGGVKTVAGLSRKRESALRELAGIGDKGIQEIKKALGNLGITLKQ